jgi:hypothetical protein
MSGTIFPFLDLDDSAPGFPDDVNITGSTAQEWMFPVAQNATVVMDPYTGTIMAGNDDDDDNEALSPPTLPDDHLDPIPRRQRFSFVKKKLPRVEWFFQCTQYCTSTVLQQQISSTRTAQYYELLLQSYSYSTS